MESNATNLDFLKNFTGGDPARMKKYVGMFLAAAPGEAEKIRNSLPAQDWDAMRASAHSLRPQMTYMGIREGESLLRQIEDKAREKTDLAQLPALVGEFDKIFAAACEELKTVLQQLN